MTGPDPGQARPGPLAIVNGKVFTASRGRPLARAVALAGGRIAAVGAAGEVLAAVPDAEVIDAGGATVLPGLIDAHNHFLATGESLAATDVRYPGVGSVDDLVAAIGRAAAAQAAGGYCDGSLIGGTAAFTAPYGADGEFTGTLFWEPGELTAAIERAHRAGWQIGVHAQGDRAIGLVLDAFERAQRAHPVSDPRFRIEHAGYPTPRQLIRMRDLDVIAVCQPSYLRDSGDDFLARLPGRAHRLQPLRAALDGRIRVVLSSDSDVASYRPLDTVAAAVLRRTSSGHPIGPDQAITVEEALLAHTIDAAHAIRAEDRIGSIEAGKAADIVVLSGDLLGCDRGQIGQLGVSLTVIGGRVAYRAA